MSIEPDQQQPEPSAEEQRFATLETRVGTTEQMIEELVSHLDALGGKGRWNWVQLDAAQRRELWAELAEFVHWLADRYLVHLDQKWQVPGCWYRHPVAVELLTSVMVAHKAAYSPRAIKPSHALVDFHERALWPTLQRLEDLKVLSSCKAKKVHQDDAAYRPRPWTPDEDFAAFVSEETDEQAGEQE